MVLVLQIILLFPKQIEKLKSSKLIKNNLSKTSKPKVYVSNMKTVSQIKDEERFNALPEIDQEIEKSYLEKYENK